MEAKLQNLPTHVALIMDGNRRWAAERDLDHLAGHREAIKRIQEIVEHATDLGIEYLTMWAWSTKNWKRNRAFIKDIIQLFREQLDDGGIFQHALEKGARLRQIGSLKRFPKDIQSRIKEYLTRGPAEPKIEVNLAIGYEGRDELIRAIRKVIRAGVSADELNKELVSSYLDTAGQPDVDLVIRTGGEYRTSGFLVWQAADAELYFADTYMPDFGKQEFTKALQNYSRRERRLGGDSQQY